MITEYKIAEKVCINDEWVEPRFERQVTFEKMDNHVRILLPLDEDEIQYFVELDELKKVGEAMNNELST